MMINLLPPKTRQDMMYARRNSALSHWSTTLVIAILGAALIIASGLVYLTQTTKNYEKRTESSRLSLKAQNIEETQKMVDEISNNVKLSTAVLSREILFSKVLTQLGAVLPADSSLQQLQIDDLKGGLTLSAGTKSIDSATQVQVNLADPKNQIFEKADIENITCDSNPDPQKKIYPCVVQIRALFMKDNPFLYISPTNTSGAKP